MVLANLQCTTTVTSQTVHSLVIHSMTDVLPYEADI